MSVEHFNNERGLSKPWTALGVAGTVGLLAGGAAIINNLDSDPEAAANNSESGDFEWVNVDGLDNTSCVELIEDAGTGETYEMTINGKEVTLVKADVGADQEGRIWNNSVRAPFESDSNDVGQLAKEIKADFCEDAALSVATAHVLGNVEYKGTRIADTEEGKWLMPYADVTAEQLDDKADHLLGLDLSRTDEENYERYQEHMKLAENLAAVLAGLQNEGLQTGKTTLDVSYSDMKFADVAAGIPEMVASYGQFDNAEALMFSVLNKGETCPTPIIGFNTGIGENGKANDGDKRPEGFTPKECDEPEETTTTAEDTTTTEPEGSTTTRPHRTTTTSTPDTTTSTRVEVAPPASTPIQGPGAGGKPDNNNNPGDNVTTSTTSTTSTPINESTTTTIRAGGTTTTTEAAGEWNG